MQLDLQSNEIGPIVAQYLSKALKMNTVSSRQHSFSSHIMHIFHIYTGTRTT